MAVLDYGKQHELPHILLLFHCEVHSDAKVARPNSQNDKK